MDENEIGAVLKQYLKKDAWESILAAVVFLLIGILVVNNPEAVVLTISYVLGGIFALVGILKIVSYFVEKGNEDFFNYDLVFGLIALIVGTIFITQASLLNTLFRVMIAIWLIYSGLIRGTTALKLKKFDVNAWWVVLISAILMVIAGIYVISYSGIVVASLGILMIAYAVIDLINGIIFIVDINKCIK